MSSLLGGRAAYLVCRKAAVESFAEAGEQLCLVRCQNRGVVTLIGFYYTVIADLGK